MKHLVYGDNLNEMRFTTWRIATSIHQGLHTISVELRQITKMSVQYENFASLENDLNPLFEPA